MQRDNKKRIGQTSVNFNYEIKIRHATLILEAVLVAEGLSLCVLNGKMFFLTKNKIKSKDRYQTYTYIRIYIHKSNLKVSAHWTQKIVNRIEMPAGRCFCYILLAL